MLKVGCFWLFLH